MIYDLPEIDEPIRQGDIFSGLPRVDLTLPQILVYNKDETVNEVPWSQILQDGKPRSIIVSVKPVTAIVMSQDCDTERESHISLCEVREFRDIYTSSKQTTSPGSWANIITQHSRRNQKWFYLPADPRFEFPEKMGADFFITIRVFLADLKSSLHLRKAKLKPVAKAHFRERIAEFFRRYPYDEWYPLNHEEFAAYKKEHPGTKPFPWQESA
jgi:hypothetical protein